MTETIGIQGRVASYHEEAALKLQPDAEMAYLETFTDVFRALESGDVGSAVVAIANNRIQFLPDTYDYIVSRNTPVQIVGETYLRIGHALLAPPGATLEGIREVHSQAPALGQCSHFMENLLRHAHSVEETDTSLSAEIVANSGDPTQAAIASEAAGKLFGLHPLRLNVQDDPSNVTRFLKIVLAANARETDDADKTSMLLTAPHIAGGLVKALVPFDENGINISYLQSRLIRSSAFHTDFFLEFESSLSDPATQDALAKVKAANYAIKLLGSYKSEVVPVVDSKNCMAIHQKAIDRAIAQRQQVGPVCVTIPKEVVMPNLVTQDLMSGMGIIRRLNGFELMPHPIDMQMMLIVDR